MYLRPLHLIIWGNDLPASPAALRSLRPWFFGFVPNTSLFTLTESHKTDHIYSLYVVSVVWCESNMKCSWTGESTGIVHVASQKMSHWHSKRLSLPDPTLLNKKVKVKSNYFIVRPKIGQRAGLLSLPHLGSFAIHMHDSGVASGGQTGQLPPPLETMTM